MICAQEDNNKFRKEVDTLPLLGLLSDVSISILVRANGMPPFFKVKRSYLRGKHPLKWMTL